MLVQREHQQGTGPFEVTLTSAGKEIKQLPPAPTDILGITPPWGKCLGLNLGYHRQGKHLGGSKPIPTLAGKLGHAAGWDAGAIHCHHPSLLVMAPHPQQPSHAAHHCWLLLRLVLLNSAAFSAGLPRTQHHPPSICAVDQIYPDTGLLFC